MYAYLAWSIIGAAGIAAVWTIGASMRQYLDQRRKIKARLDALRSRNRPAVAYRDYDGIIITHIRH